MRIDLHTHSAMSDGTDTPAELVHAAAAAGLDVIALTDHDTTAGWREAADALPGSLTLIPGAELSCVSDSGRGWPISVHLLAFLFDPQAEAIVAEQRRLRAERRLRLGKMAARMAADGLPVDPQAVLAALPNDAPAGRPHLARALVEAGAVTTVNEAFDRYLGSGGRYYLPRADTPVATAIDMIDAAGGVTVLAHPWAYSRGPTVSADVIADLAQRGLRGIEADHPNHDPQTRVELRGLAAELGLLVTGSSDYHGSNKDIPLGAETTDPAVLEQIVALATGAKPIQGGGA